MKAVKIVAIALAAYVGIVVLFESMIGYLQPETEETIVIHTTDADGETYQRVVDRIESGGQVYVAVNHWPRAWYHRIVENPEVLVDFAGETLDYRAVEVTDEAEFERVDSADARPFVFKFVTGFPPRRLIRLEPRTAGP